MDAEQARSIKTHVDGVWDSSIVPAISDYIRIPNKSPLFDPSWREHGFMAKAVKLIETWCKARAIAGLSVEVIEIEGRTPVIFMEIPGSTDDTILLYGHLDKQPEMVGWGEGLSPWEPVIRGDRLYGRGGADDGYSAFASLLAIEALQKQKIPHARCVVLIEACEESGSVDLPAYIVALKSRIGAVSLVICLDSGCGNYDQLWSTTSLRGLVVGNLIVEVLKEGVHSGDATGLVPSTFRILRQLLSRLEDERTGEILIPELHAQIPEARIAQAKVAASVLGDEVWNKYLWQEGAGPISKDNAQLILNRTWKPGLAITGARGLPDLQDAGNVMRPVTAVKISMRLPPTVDPDAAQRRIKEVLEANPPYGAKVSLQGDKASRGWDAPALAPWLFAAVDGASKAHFGKEAVYMGEGGSIPFMGMLGEQYPAAQFLITGVLGPQSNAHGPNEFLHIPTGKHLTACVAEVIVAHLNRSL